jgi:hypothetical protein
MTANELRKVAETLVKSRDIEIADIHQDLKPDAVNRAVKKVAEHSLRLAKTKRVIVLSFVVP